MVHTLGGLGHPEITRGSLIPTLWVSHRSFGDMGGESAGCLPEVVERCRKCPTCDVAFGAQPVAERGAHVRAAPTFVMPR